MELLQALCQRIFAEAAASEFEQIKRYFEQLQG
jgi:hypothetical protein